MGVLAQHVVHYAELLDNARSENAHNITAYLRNHLPFKWRDSYVAVVGRPTNIVRFPSRSFEYIFDIYSELEANGEVPYDQTVEDRVVAVFGVSNGPCEQRDGARMRGWLGEIGELVGAT